MESQLKPERGSKYWVLFLQPLPEAGERIAIALVFHDEGGRPRVEFDRSLSKALELFPDLDKDGLLVYLDSLQRELLSSCDVESTLNSYGPQISASSPRRIASPISEKVVEMLLARYVRRAKPRPNVPSFADASAFIERWPQTIPFFSWGTIQRSLETPTYALAFTNQGCPTQSLVKQTQPERLGLRT